jgi:hypothetical protein
MTIHRAYEIGSMIEDSTGRFGRIESIRAYPIKGGKSHRIRIQAGAVVIEDAYGKDIGKWEIIEEGRQ